MQAKDEGNGKATKIAVLETEIKNLAEKVTAMAKNCTKHSEEYMEQATIVAVVESNIKDIRNDINALFAKNRSGRNLAMPAGMAGVIVFIIEIVKYLVN